MRRRNNSMFHLCDTAFPQEKRFQRSSSSASSNVSVSRFSMQSDPPKFFTCLSPIVPERCVQDQADRSSPVTTPKLSMRTELLYPRANSEILWCAPIQPALNIGTSTNEPKTQSRASGFRTGDKYSQDTDE